MCKRAFRIGWKKEQQQHVVFFSMKSQFLFWLQIKIFNLQFTFALMYKICDKIISENHKKNKYEMNQQKKINIFTLNIIYIFISLPQSSQYDYYPHASIELNLYLFVVFHLSVFASIYLCDNFSIAIRNYFSFLLMLFVSRIIL